MDIQLIRLDWLITTFHICRSHQEAAPAGNDDVQAVQGSSEQAQGITMN